MDANKFRREIFASWEFFKKLSLERSFITPVSLAVDEAVRNVSFDRSSLYWEIYVISLSRSNYNILLEDYSLLQFSFDQVDYWRLGYLPNPWISGVEDAATKIAHWEAMEEAGLLSYEDVSELASELPYHAAIPPLRFDYAPVHYREIAHPAAHIHIGRHPDNRWPSSVKLGPLAFSMLIGKFFYTDRWAPKSKFFDEEITSCLDMDLIACLAAAGPVSQFTATETNSFHVGQSFSVPLPPKGKGAPARAARPR